MRHHLIPLGFAVLLSAALPSHAQDSAGAKLYSAAVTEAKLLAQTVQPVPSYQTLVEKEALKISQAAIGNQLGDYTFLSHSRGKVRLSDYRGKPLVASLTSTNCPFVCATTTRNLK